MGKLLGGDLKLGNKPREKNIRRKQKPSAQKSRLGAAAEGFEKNWVKSLGGTYVGKRTIGSKNVRVLTDFEFRPNGRIY